MQIPLLERDQKPREFSHRPRHGDSFVRNAFGEVQHLDAVVKHRGARLLEVEPTRVDLSQVRNQLGLEAVIAPDQIMQPNQELITGQAS